jgi:hypothetical protein
MNWQRDVKNLRHGEHFIIPEGSNDDCGKGEVWRINSRFFLFEIPQYGGEPMFAAHFEANEFGADALIKMVESWT